MSLTITEGINAYIEDCVARELSPRTLEGKSSTLAQFERFCAAEGVSYITDINLRCLRGYQAFLVNYRTKQGRPLDVTTRRNKCVTVREFCKRLYMLELLEDNPAGRFEVPKRPRRLPDSVLSDEELDAIFAQTTLHGDDGKRDLVMLETYYSTAMRRAELTRLRLSDIDIKKRLIRINKGKGQKDRIVPFAPRTADMLVDYVNGLRRKQIRFSSGDWLFLDNSSQQFSPQKVSRLVRKYVIRAGVNRRGACNLFRHTVATQMLENGADIRVIQVLLGHEDLSTTQVYTKIRDQNLIDTFGRTHPAAFTNFPDHII